MHRRRTRSALALIALAALLAGAPAQAHWCHDLWGSSYNIVVKPATDTVNVPAGGSATLDVFVQNNMGYALINFALRATATGYTISIARQSPKVTGFLMPAENLRHTLTISSTAGGTLTMANLNFYVDFGEGTQDQLYGGGTNGARHTVVRKNDGTLKPVAPVTVPAADGQALHLGASAKADFQNLGAGLDDLMAEFCAGRGSWDSNGAPPNTTYCSGTATTCPAQTTRGHTKYDYQHLWASAELAYRKASLGARVGPLRARLICAANDTSPSFKWFPYAMLGYLGEDATARAFLTGKISSGTADEQAAAKAALLLFGNAADRTAHYAAVTAARGTANEYVQMLAGTTLGIIDNDDAAVEQELIARSLWVEPDTSDNGKAMFAAHLLNVVAWSRRGWAVEGNYAGTVSFYGGPADTTPPRAPTGTSCTPMANGTLRVTWSAVNQDTSGNPESIQTYRVYGGTTTRPGGVTRPAEQGFDYDHVDPTAGVFFNFTGLAGTSTHYFTVTAVDMAGNASVYGTEVSCVPRYPPVARVSCAPTSGTAPLAVSCDSAASSDPNGTADITTRAWTLDGTAQTPGATFSTTLATPGAHVVQLTVTDSTGLFSTASTTVNANSATNQSPVAAAAATPSSGPVPLSVQFSSTGSSDPDTGQTLSYSWDFGDGTAASTQANPSHTFVNAGTWDVYLSVTDDGTPPATSRALVRVTSTGNSPPDLTTASATPSSGNAPLQVRFDGSGVTDPDGDTVLYRWSFGDGTADATTASANHTYATAGTYTARLSANDNGTPALTAPVTKDFPITVRPPGAVNRPPDCSAATVTPSSGPAPLTVTLDATGCVDPDGDQLTFTWRVPRTITTEDVFNEARVTTTFADPAETEARLHVRESSASPLELDLTFPVTVTDPAGDAVFGSCGCTAAGGLELLAAFAALGLLRRRKRR